MAGGCQSRRWFAVTLLAVTGSLSALATARAADDGQWFVDRATAAIQARKQGKLLLVVDLSGDFARNAPEAREALVYRRITLADRRIAEALAQRFVVTMWHCGEPVAFQRQSPPKRSAEARPAEFAITYVCLPDERVIHFFPGFVSGEELLAQLDFAERSYAAMMKVQAADQALAIRRAHLSAASSDDLAVFQRLFTTRWKDNALAEGISTVDLPAALAAAKSTFERSLTTRLGANWSRGEADGLLAALSAHGGLAAEMSHLVLAEFPLPELRDIQRPAFETLAEQRFWQPSRRRDSLAKWWSEAVTSGRPLLLVVGDDRYFTDSRRTELLAWPPEHATQVPDLPRFAWQVVTLDEAALLASDANRGVSYKHNELPPRFVLYDRRGQYADQVGRNEGITRLAKAMHAAIRPGVLDASTDVLGGTRDEPD